MSLGMLLAGAMTGGARAVDQMADTAIRSREMEQARTQSLMDRRNELLFEMKAKADMAKRAEMEDAQKYEGAVGRAERVGDDRRFAKFREDIKASGGGEGMDDNQLREVFNSYYNNKQATAEPGGDRYMEPESRNKADILDELRKGGASGGLLKSAREDLTLTQRAEQQSRAEALKERQLDQRERLAREDQDRRDERAQARIDAQLQIAEMRGRGGSGGGGGKGPEIDQTEKLTVLKDVKAKADATRPKRSDYTNEKKYEAAMQKWQESEDGQISAQASRRIRSLFGDEGVNPQGSAPASGAPSPASPASRAKSDIEALNREIAAVERGNDPPAKKQERLDILRSELAKAERASSQGGESTKKDNPQTKVNRVGEERTVASGPHAGKTAVWDGNGWKLK